MVRGENLTSQSVLAPVTHLFERRNRAVKRLGRQITRSYQHILPSVGTFLVEQPVYDMSTGQEGTKIGVGAGSVVDYDRRKGVATWVTNAHVMQGVLQGGQAVVETSGVVNGVQNDANKVQIPIDPNLVWISPDHDVAFAMVQLPKSVQVRALDVRSDIPLPAGKPVITVGAPHAIENVVAPQNYIALGGLQEQTGEDGRTDMYVQLGGSINPGNSGGPTLDHSYRKPKVVGMVTLGIQGDPTTAFMLPASTIVGEYPKFRRDMQARNAQAPVDLPEAA